MIFYSPLTDSWFSGKSVWDSPLRIKYPAAATVLVFSPVLCCRPSWCAISIHAAWMGKVMPKYSPMSCKRQHETATAECHPIGMKQREKETAEHTSVTFYIPFTQHTISLPVTTGSKRIGSNTGIRQKKNHNLQRGLGHGRGIALLSFGDSQF